jgi:hypothetical protein
MVTPSPLAPLESRSENAFLRYSIATIIGLGWLVYLPALNAPFLFDDWIRIVVPGRNSVHQLWPWGPSPELSRWLGTWTFQLSYAIFGLNRLGWHTTNIAIHVAAGCVLFGLIWQILGRPGIPAWLAAHRRWLALSAALIWVVHPLQTQAVTYTVQRYESLMGLFYLLTLYCLVRGVESIRPWTWYAASVAACWAGAGTKEVMVSAPLVALLVDRSYLAASWREIWRRRWGLYLGLFASVAWLVFASSTATLNHPAEGAGFGISVTPWQYLRSQPAVLLHYGWLVFWPAELTFDYGWPVETSPWRIYGLGAVILLLLGWSLWGVWRAPRIGIVALAVFLILAITSSILPIADLAFEHRMYLPSACVVLLALVGAAVLAERTIANPRWQAWTLWGGAAVFVVALSIRTTIRNVEYRDPIAMFTRLAEKNPGYGRHYNHLCLHLMLAGRRDEAMQAVERSLAVTPDNHQSWRQFGDLFMVMREYERAIDMYRLAAEVDPRDSIAFLKISNCDAILGNYAAAVGAARQALACNPHDARLREQTAWLLSTVPDDALRNGEEALSLLEAIPSEQRQSGTRWLVAYAAALAEAGRFDEAISAADRAVLAAELVHSKRVDEIRDQRHSYRDGKPWRIVPAQQSITAENSPPPTAASELDSN